MHFSTEIVFMLQTERNMNLTVWTHGDGTKIKNNNLFDNCGLLE